MLFTAGGVLFAEGGFGAITRAAAVAANALVARRPPNREGDMCASWRDALSRNSIRRETSRRQRDKIFSDANKVIFIFE